MIWVHLSEANLSSLTQECMCNSISKNLKVSATTFQRFKYSKQVKWWETSDIKVQDRKAVAQTLSGENIWWKKKLGMTGISFPFSSVLEGTDSKIAFHLAKTLHIWYFIFEMTKVSLTLNHRPKFFFYSKNITLVWNVHRFLEKWGKSALIHMFFKMYYQFRFLKRYL